MPKKDMGPFVGMAADLVEGVTRYGTPPYRQSITIEVRSVHHYSFDKLPTTIIGWIEWLTEAMAEVPVEYRKDIRCMLDHDSYFDDCSRTLVVSYQRLETDEEMTKRVNEGIKYIMEKAAKELSTYQALKKKFES